MVRPMSWDEMESHRGELTELLRDVYAENFPAPVYEHIDAAASYREMREYADQGAATILGSFDGQTLRGFAWIYPRRQGGRLRLHVQHIAVKSADRGKGVGGKILREIERIARSTGGCEGVELMATLSNERTMRFYEKNGYSPERALMIRECEP